MSVEALLDTNVLWDAAIVAAAHVLGTGILYAEDLNHGQMYDGVRVVNPFLAPEPPA